MTEDDMGWEFARRLAKKLDRRLVKILGLGGRLNKPGWEVWIDHDGEFRAFKIHATMSEAYKAKSFRIVEGTEINEVFFD